MRVGRPPKAPIYVLPHGIEVIGEYKPTKKNPYWRARIRPHPFFQGITVRSNGMYVKRSRVILASKLGRALMPDELAHHDDEDKTNDSPVNLGPLSSAEHNRYHKTGASHAAGVAERIAVSLRLAYAEGRRARPTITNRDNKGRIAP